MKQSIGILTLILHAALGCDGHADTTQPVPLFASDGLLHLSLEGPLTTIRKDRRSDEPEYHPAVLTINEQGTASGLDIRIRTRGHFRRSRDICKFPPLRLNFSSQQVANTLFESQDKLKIVTQCHSNEKYAQLIIKEYLSYRILSLFTVKSFQVRLARIDYIDTDRKNRTDTHLAFLIEHKRAMAQRHAAHISDLPKIKPAQLDSMQATIAEVFSFLIGNVDWSMLAGREGESCCHNFVLSTFDEQTFFPIPYDFDFSGVVNAPYAGPDPRLKLKSIRQRLYRGRCREKRYLPQVLELFRTQKPAIYALYLDQKELSPRTRGDALAYLDKFYTIISDPKQVDRKMYAVCRG